jgi:hypothetical protein
LFTRPSATVTGQHVYSVQGGGGTPADFNALVGAGGALAKQVGTSLAIRSRCSCRPLCMCAPPIRGLHSFTFQLNVGAFCGIRSEYRGCLGAVPETLTDFRE